MKSRRDIIPELEDLYLHHGEYLVSMDTIPTRSKQVESEILQLQKEFACSIYIQRDKERWL